MWFQRKTDDVELESEEAKKVKKDEAEESTAVQPAAEEDAKENVPVEEEASYKLTRILLTRILFQTVVILFVEFR